MVALICWVLGRHSQSLPPPPLGTCGSFNPFRDVVSFFFFSNGVCQGRVLVVFCPFIWGPFHSFLIQSRTVFFFSCLHPRFLTGLFPRPPPADGYVFCPRNAFFLRVRSVFRFSSTGSLFRHLPRFSSYFFGSGNGSAFTVPFPLINFRERFRLSIQFLSLPKVGWGPLFRRSLVFPRGQVCDLFWCRDRIVLLFRSLFLGFFRLVFCGPFPLVPLPSADFSWPPAKSFLPPVAAVVFPFFLVFLSPGQTPSELLLFIGRVPKGFTQALRLSPPH